jgi:hypothetical protein
VVVAVVVACYPANLRQRWVPVTASLLAGVVAVTAMEIHPFFTHLQHSEVVEGLHNLTPQVMVVQEVAVGMTVLFLAAMEPLGKGMTAAMVTPAVMLP